jgi:hypothetical protein
MKKMISILLFPINLNSQPIDYNNFDNKRAEKVLFETLQYFRDTIKRFGDGSVISEYFSDLPNYKQLMKLTWSDNVYKNFSKRNIEIISQENRLHHADNNQERIDWWMNIENRQVFAKEIYVKYDTPYGPPIQFMDYFENAVSSTQKYKTYQEMATDMIMIWEGSRSHKYVQRGPLFYVNEHRKYGSKIQTKSLVACAVRYSNGKFFAVVNYVN